MVVEYLPELVAFDLDIYPHALTRILSVTEV